MKTSLYSFLYKEKDASILSLYRIVFGFFMLYQMIYYFKSDYTYQLMAGPEFLFHYPYLKFLAPLPDPVLQVLLIGLIISTLLIITGIFYRFAITFFFLGFSYFSFIDKTIYNNHLYLIALIAFVMIFMEADKKYSLKKLKNGKKKTVPNWNVRLLQFLFIVVYFYGGLAKLTTDWLDGSIPEIMCQASDGSLLHNLLPKKLLVNLITFGGILYDLSISFILLYKPSRKIGVLLVLFFNLTNGMVLFGDIGLFPYFMICSTILFFDPAVVDNFIKTLLPQKERPGKKKRTVQKTAATLKSAVGNTWTRRQNITTGAICLFVIFQLLFPLRYIPLTDNPEWTGIGSRFAWRMKMQSRKLIEMEVNLTDRITGVATKVDHTSFVSANQFSHMIEDPYAVVQFAKYLNRKGTERGMTDPLVKAKILISFNGRTPQLMIDPTTDLSRVDESPFAKNDWIKPLMPKQ